MLTTLGFYQIWNLFYRKELTLGRITTIFAAGLAPIILSACVESEITTRPQSVTVSSTSLVAQDISTSQALCNDGSEAKFFKSEGTYSKWLVYLPGGGGLWSAADYSSRPRARMTADRRSQINVSEYPVTEHFASMGYGVVVADYCSSDLYGGDHQQDVAGNSIEMRGRSIVEGMLADVRSELASAEEVVFAGTSAGAFGLALNADLIGSFPRAAFIADGIWRDEYQVSQSDYGNDTDWLDFTLAALPSHCNGDFYRNCNVTRSSFARHGLRDGFIVFNYGDPYLYISDDQIEPFVESLRSDMNRVGGGFSVNAEAMRISGAENWGHGLLSHRNYNRTVNGQSLASTIENWISGEDGAIHIAY